MLYIQTQDYTVVPNQKELNQVSVQRSGKGLGPLDQIFWMRIALGMLGGFVAGALGYLSSNPQAFRSGVGICFMTYVASYILARWFIGQHLPPTDYRKMVTTGLAGYVFMFLVVWILYNTFVMANQTG